jgi:hypothetical protein
VRFQTVASVRTDTKDGVKLDEVRPGSTLQIITQHTCYMVRMLFGRMVLISGHQIYCPQPVLVTIHGGSRLDVGFIGCGMRLTFHRPKYRTPIITSPIKQIRKCPEIRGWNISSII